MLSGLVLLLLFFLLLWKRLRTSDPQTKKTLQNNIAKDIYSYLIEIGFYFKQAQYITAQAAFETANFTSQVYKENNNLFGMKDASQRPNKQNGLKNGYGYYNDIYESLKDFALYYKYYKYSVVYESLKDYVTSLKKNGYFTATEKEYYNGVNFYKTLLFGN